ncbi:sensor histidine kinase [Acrocarpospora corrugata]|nr:ATP-binding protein [Acrocarpospora corrugata]
MLFLVSGLLAHYRRPTNRVGLLMMGVAIGFFAEDLQLSGVAWAHTLGQLTVAASSPFLVQLALAFPTGRLETRPQRILAGVAYAGAAATGLIIALFVDQHARFAENAVGLLLISDNVAVESVMKVASPLTAFFVSVGLMVVLIRRWLRSRQLMRSLLAPVLTLLIAGGLFSSIGQFSQSFSFIEDRFSLYDTFIRSYDVFFAILPLAFLSGMIYFYLGRGAVNRLLRQLREPKEVGEIEELLSHSLRDDSLRVAFTADPGPVDEQGAPVPIAPFQTVTPLGGSGHRQAVLVHDSLLTEDPRVLEAVAAAAGLALANQSLAAQVAAQLAEVRASRARIVKAADDERRRIEQNLHDSAQSRLVTALLNVNLVRRTLARQDAREADLLALVSEALTASLAEIRVLAQGLYPALLTAGGLSIAVDELVAQLPLPVDTDLGPLPRFAPEVEAAAYFVVAEGLTNALKHAQATRLRVGMRHAGATLTVTVADDGRGGADHATGSGLQGLLDRVAALGGDLTLHSPAQGGTTIKAVLPVDTR